MAPWVKICGVRDAACVEACVAAGAEFIGFNFVATSRRRVTVEQVEAWLPLVGGLSTAVGVFADAPVAHVMRVARRLGLGAVQLHGQESPAYCSAVGGSFEVWKGLPHTAEVGPYIGVVDRVVIDGAAPGSGRAWEWAARGWPIPGLVAGGLTAATVRAALVASGASGVDVASGVEESGVMSPSLIAAFVAAAREGAV